MIVTVECIDTLDPKVVRVTITDPITNTVIYVFDIPSVVYNVVALTNGWPSDPCA